MCERYGMSTTHTETAMIAAAATAIVRHDLSLALPTRLWLGGRFVHAIKWDEEFSAPECIEVKSERIEDNIVTPQQALTFLATYNRKALLLGDPPNG